MESIERIVAEFERGPISQRNAIEVLLAIDRYGNEVRPGRKLFEIAQKVKGAVSANGLTTITIDGQTFSPEGCLSILHQLDQDMQFIQSLRDRVVMAQAKAGVSSLGHYEVHFGGETIVIPWLANELMSLTPQDFKVVRAYRHRCVDFFIKAVTAPSQFRGLWMNGMNGGEVWIQWDVPNLRAMNKPIQVLGRRCDRIDWGILYTKTCNGRDGTYDVLFLMTGVGGTPLKMRPFVSMFATGLFPPNG